MTTQVEQISDKVRNELPRIAHLREEMGRVLVGQSYMIERLFIGFLSEGHILVEGLPGLAKTTAIKTLSNCVQATFSRIQFTPDLLPADVIGTLIYNPTQANFSVKKGPIFANLVLADEINRAPAKVQSALLEAMQERQVTIGSESYKLDDPFLVLATQNPIEQQGTYPLPEAQVDRFMLKLKVTYPSLEEELEIMNRNMSNESYHVKPLLTPNELKNMQKIVSEIYMDEKIKNYILNIVHCSRNPEKYKLQNLKQMISIGASPRASIFLAKAAKAHAFIQGRGYVTPHDVKMMAPDVMRHRIMISYEAEAEELTSDHILTEILNRIDVP